MTSHPLEVMIGERGSGKTLALLQWMIAGKEHFENREKPMPGPTASFAEIREWEQNKVVRVRSYPGWTRVIVVPTLHEVDRLGKVLKQVSSQRWEDLDVAHRIFSWADYTSAGQFHPETQVCIDGMDDIVRQLLPHLPGRLVGVSVNAVPRKDFKIETIKPPAR